MTDMVVTQADQQDRRVFVRLSIPRFRVKSLVSREPE